MARIRQIKPEFFRSEDVAGLEPMARLLFIGLWTIADREGRILDRPRRIAAELFPYDRLDEQIDMLLAMLAARELIVRYTAAGKPCIQIKNFVKHQKPHQKEPKSEIPAQDAIGTSGASPGKTGPNQEGPGETGPAQVEKPSSSVGSGSLGSGSLEPPTPKPDPGETDPSPVLDPLTVSGLVSLITAEVQRQRPELGMYYHGRWAFDRVETFLNCIPAELRTDATRAEIRARIVAFARSKDQRIKGKGWQVEAFTEHYASLGEAARNTGPPLAGLEKYRDRPHIPKRKEANGPG